MTRATLPSYERREQTYTDDERGRAQAVADGDVLVYCPECECSHPANRDDGYAVDCPNQ